MATIPLSTKYSTIDTLQLSALVQMLCQENKVDIGNLIYYLKNGMGFTQNPNLYQTYHNQPYDYEGFYRATSGPIPTIETKEKKGKDIIAYYYNR